MTDKAIAVLEKSASEFAGNNRIKQRVLEEKEYLSVLDQIVERDFYPELTKLKLRTAYIEALDNNDVECLRKIQLQLESATPRVITQKKEWHLKFREHSSNGENESFNRTSDETISRNISLDNFLSKNTSEDNASFEKIMEITRQKQSEKLAWLHQQQIELHQKLDSSKALPISALQQILDTEKKSNNLDTWKYVARNALMYTPDGVQFTAEELIQSKGKKGKEIRHENTRFNSDPFDNQASHTAMMKASRDQTNLKKAIGKVGVDGKLENQSDATANIQGCNFVAEPSPDPGVISSPLMTWGEIEGTPMRLDATPTATVFRIPEPPRREQLAHTLVERANKQHREKRKKAFAAATATLWSPKHTPKSTMITSERLSRLSPAARTLMKSSLRTNSDKFLRSGYTPSIPQIQTPTTKKMKTPGSSRMKDSHRRATQVGSSITDNLLNLPKS